MTPVSELRLALKAAGFSPIPCNGKRPLLAEWPTKDDASTDDIAYWERAAARLGTNTGILTAKTPAIDADIMHPEAAAAVEDLAKEWFDGKGSLLVRIGEAPKRAMLFRTTQPFAKMAAYFTDPKGEPHKIEVLGAGQQIVVDGTHPDTRKAYTWHGGYSPWAIGHDNLPELTEEEAQDFLELAADMLQEQFGFVRVQANGGADSTATQREPGEWKPRVDVDARLENMRPKGQGGSSIHDTEVSVTASLLCRGASVEEAIRTVLDGLKSKGDTTAGWDWALEEHGLRVQCMGWVNKHPELSGSLSEELRIPFEAFLAEGRKPCICFRRDTRYWYVKRCREDYSANKKDTADDGEANATPGEEPKGKPKKFKILPFVAFDLAALPPREFLYGKHYQRHTVSMTAAPGGFGKTTQGMVEGVAMATARNLLGEQPGERFRVWYHNGEDNLRELNRRLGAICLHYDIPLKELEGWFFMTSGNEVPLRVANGYGDLKIDTTLIKCIEEEISSNAIDVAILDPLVTLHSVSEQDNSKMDSVVRIFAGIADARGCSIDLAHHTRKLLAGTSTGYGGDDMRGASAIKDAVRAARMLNQMTEKEAQDVGIPEHERTAYFRVDRVKGNNAPLSKPVWRRFVSVELPNSDEVGVVVPWNFPGQGAPSPEMATAERAAEAVFLSLLARLTLEGRTVSASAGSNYAPNLFYQEPEAKAGKIGKRVLADAMRRLFATNRIRVEQHGEGTHRVNRIVTT
jgi:RecA-family ATPase